MLSPCPFFLIKRHREPMSWRGSTIEVSHWLLLTRQGGNPDIVPKWADTDFDSIYVIRFSADDKGLRQAHFSIEKQGLDGLPNQCSEGFPVSHSN